MFPCLFGFQRPPWDKSNRQRRFMIHWRAVASPARKNRHKKTWIMDLVLDVLISLYRVLQKGFYLVLDLTSWPGPIHANYFLGNLYLNYKIMPLTRCRGECHEYAFFGVQAWNWCWCGNTAPPANRKKSESECAISCPGESDKKCGGHWRMNIYTQG